MDFTTVARGYVEAQKRGLIESRVGQGTFVRGQAARAGRAPRTSRRSFDEPAARTRRPRVDLAHAGGLAEVRATSSALLRYQGFGGSPADKDAASSWLGRRA